MRISSAFFLAFLLGFASCTYAGAKCSGDNSLRLANGRFALCLPINFYKNATIAPGGDIVVKLADGSGFGIQIFQSSMDSLPENFDMRSYPELVLGLKPATGLDEIQVEKLKNTVAVFKSSELGAVPLKKYKKNGKKFYWLSKGRSAVAIAYVTIDEADDQVLFFTFHKMDEKLQQTILNGVQ